MLEGTCPLDGGRLRPEAVLLLLDQDPGEPLNDAPAAVGVCEFCGARWSARSLPGPGDSYTISGSWTE